MTNLNVLLSEELGIVGTIDPDVYAAAADSDLIDMAKFEQLFGIALLGDLAAFTVDFAVTAYTDSAGTLNGTAIKATTQLAADAALNDDLQLGIVIRREDLVAKDTATTIAAGGLRYVKFTLTSVNQTGEMAAIILAGGARDGMEAKHNLATVTEIEIDLS